MTTLSSSKLALLGGKPVRVHPYPEPRTIGAEERQAVLEVLDDGVLSRFLATWSDEFFGGPRVRELERRWAERFHVTHAVAMNSATSGLYAAVGAAGVGPGDEVIVSPYTMTASAVAPVVYGATPVFADIDPRTFAITRESIEPCLTSRTKAIIVVDIFGQPAEMDPIMDLARDKNLVVIEDAAQAAGAVYKRRPAGTLAHIGVYSLNYHKTIHCGEGGVVVTDDADLAERLQLIRNHAETVVKAKGVTNLVNMVGFNYRMTEIEAAIAGEQLRKLDALVSQRQERAAALTDWLTGSPGITPPFVLPHVTHGYYLYVMRYDQNATGIPRELFVKAMRAEGIPLVAGYVEPLYLQPIYQQRIGIGREGFPFTGGRRVSYERGICPVVEQMHFNEVIFTNIVHAGVTLDALRDFQRAVDKVAAARQSLIAQVADDRPAVNSLQ